MAKPQWTTTAGTLATINERVSYSKTLVASEGNGDTLSFSKIAGELPPGITLSTAGLLAGVPLEVDRRKQFKFVVRATNGTQSVDRTFDLVVEGADAPTWTTAAGNILNVQNGDYVRYQLQATDQDDTIIEYRIVSGALPNNLSLSKKTGLITGIVAFDIENTSKTHTFTVRASDGAKYTDREFNIVYQSNALPPRSDSIIVTADTTSTTTDKDDITALYWLQSENSIIGNVFHQRYNIIDVDVFNPGDISEREGDTTLTYSISAGSLPPGMSISSNSGEIYGLIPLIYTAETTYTFTVQVVKSSSLFVSSTYTRQFSIKVFGQGYNEITWSTQQKELNL